MPSLAYDAPVAGNTGVPEQAELVSKGAELVSKGAALEMHENEEMLPEAPATEDTEASILEEANSAEAKVSMSLQARQEWMVGAEIILQDSEDSPTGARSTSLVSAAAAEQDDENTAELEEEARGQGDSEEHTRARHTCSSPCALHP